jgi:tRNA-specific 2-thiouridylase
MAKVLAAMSGGVDSSVAAALMIERGYDVIGATMRIWSGEPLPQGDRHSCYGPEEEDDIADAQRVAAALKIPFFVLDLRDVYRQEVLDYTGREYCSGRTPNPCVRCNRRIKFDYLVDKARNTGLEFDYLAMGHYARVKYDETNGRYLLKKAVDSNKDQSYFLHLLTQQQLKLSLFPIGDYTKDQVRAKAQELKLDVADKPESQNFMAGGYSALFDTLDEPGSILDKQGNVLGQHKGIAHYTIGQRRGLAVAAKDPLYVTGIDSQHNTVYVGTKAELYKDKLTAIDLNWIAMDNLTEPMMFKAKIRYRHTEAAARLMPHADGRVFVKFDEPQLSITPGQAVVFYQGDTVVGGGTIEC